MEHRVQAGGTSEQGAGATPTPRRSIAVDDTLIESKAALALDATWAASSAGGSVPAAAAAAPTPPKPGATTLSVLPRFEMSDGGVRLLPSSGPRYERLRALGEGGMGEVSLVEDRDIGRTVAVKRLRDPETTGPGPLARFVDEVKLTGSLEHPNIVPIHDVGVDEHGQYFFVMKFVDGETLEAVIERLRAGDPATIRAWPVSRRLEVFEGLLRALEYAHARNILHRDIKPANIMVGRFGEVVLMDWGIARPIGAAELPRESAEENAKARPSRASDTHHGALIGTPLYMSPEQASGQTDTLDARSDLYTASLVLHELLGLRARREGHPHVMAMVTAAITEDAPAPTDMFSPHPSNPDGIAPEFRHFLHRGLALSPQERWGSASEMLAELAAIAEGRCRIQCPMTLTKRGTRELGRFVDRRPVLAVSSMAAVAISMTTLAVYALQHLLLG